MVNGSWMSACVVASVAQGAEVQAGFMVDGGGKELVGRGAARWRVQVLDGALRNGRRAGVNRMMTPLAAYVTGMCCREAA